MRVGLIGYPIEHSMSPALQQPAFDKLGIDATYELWETPPEGVADRVAGLRENGVLGANVTAPHKQAVIPHLDAVREMGRRAGAVNTIVSTVSSSLSASMGSLSSGVRTIARVRNAP